jgi:hypothetical protein
MGNITIPWAPRVILTGRTFRLPVKGQGASLQAEGFEEVARRYVEPDRAEYVYLTAPQTPGDYGLKAGAGDDVVVQVRSLDQLRALHTFNGAQWPRRWPLGKDIASTKRRQTLQDGPARVRGGGGQTDWWMEQPDEVIWAQLPPSEIPRAHFTNCHQGCPGCGTAVFRHSGFYPWRRSHRPCDFRSTCPSCGAVYPSNDLAQGDFVSGDFVDDGYGYFDPGGHIYLFAATYHRDQIQAFVAGMGALSRRLQSDPTDEAAARRLGLMLARYAVEECYLAAVPQFRYGPSKGVEEPWDWGVPDWATEKDPVEALRRKGALHYSIASPGIARLIAFAYDSVWPLMKEDDRLVEQLKPFGVPVANPEDVVCLVEEMLASQLQCILDRGASTNLPGESLGALTLLRSLDRGDARDVMDWVYDEGPDTVRVFATNDFFPDGTPQEATGGYNSIHSNGLFDLEYQLRALRELQPEAYPEATYPSLMSDPRTSRVPRVLHEITMAGKSFFQFGDGSSPGTAATHGSVTERKDESIRLGPDCFHGPMSPDLLEQAEAYTGDPMVAEIRAAVTQGRHRRIGSTVHDGVGLAILRTPEAPERAAVGIVYGDSLHHRHRDLLDVQLYAFERPFLTDLGYPQSWASIGPWEAHWATHNTVWGTLDPDAPRDAGRGRLIRMLEADGVQILDVAGERWGVVEDRWRPLGVRYRRLVALVETDGDGVAVVDLARITGGLEHWRTCRGLEGEFLPSTPLNEQGGTVAHPDSGRGDMSRLSHPDYAAMAYLDDVATAPDAAAFGGSWQSRAEPGVSMDLHQLRISGGTEAMTARAAAMMGTPEESSYCYRATVWRRIPNGPDDTTAVDLVMEPRLGAPTLARAEAIRSASPGAGGVLLDTVAGRQVRIYWAPESRPDTEAGFEDGTVLCGPLAANVDGTVVSNGCTSISVNGVSRALAGGSQVGRIEALDRDARTIDVAGLGGVQAGERIRINASQRGHSYLVEEASDLGEGAWRLKLDVVSVLGRAPVLETVGRRMSFGFAILTRSGNLHQTRIQVEPDGPWAEIVDASSPVGWPPGKVRTIVEASPDVGDASAVCGAEPGTWMQIVDYVVGDPVTYEPTLGG